MTASRRNAFAYLSLEVRWTHLVNSSGWSDYDVPRVDGAFTDYECVVYSTCSGRVSPDEMWISYQIGIDPELLDRLIADIAKLHLVVGVSHAPCNPPAVLAAQAGRYGRMLGTC